MKKLLMIILLVIVVFVSESQTRVMFTKFDILRNMKALNIQDSEIYYDTNLDSISNMYCEYEGCMFVYSFLGEITNSSVCIQTSVFTTLRSKIDEIVENTQYNKSVYIDDQFNFHYFYNGFKITGKLIYNENGKEANNYMVIFKLRL